MAKREDAVNNLFTNDDPNTIEEESEHMRNMMAKLVPARVESDYKNARHLIFARRDRLDKIKEVLFNISMVLLALLLYLVFNSFIFKEILSSLYGMTHESWSYTSTVLFHGGSLRIASSGNIGVNVAGNYPLEVLPKTTGNDNVIRLRNNGGSAQPSQRMAVVFGNQG